MNAWLPLSSNNMNHLHVKVCKTAANSGSETSGATGLEPNAANCNKNVEKFFFLFFDVWFFITQAPRQMVHQNSDNSAFNIQPQVFQGLFETHQCPWVCYHRNKTAPLGWFNPKSQRKSKTKSTELISSSMAGPLKEQKNNSQKTDITVSHLKHNI